MARVRPQRTSVPSSALRCHATQVPTVPRLVVRATDESHRVTTLELFFDLVFVFALTQVTQLMADDPTTRGTAARPGTARPALVRLVVLRVAGQPGAGGRGRPAAGDGRRDGSDVRRRAGDPGGVRRPARRAVRALRPGRLLRHRPRCAPGGLPRRGRRRQGPAAPVADDGDPDERRVLPACRRWCRRPALAVRAVGARPRRRLRRGVALRHRGLAGQQRRPLRRAARPDRDRRARRVDRRDRRRRGRQGGDRAGRPGRDAGAGRVDRHVVGLLRRGGTGRGAGPRPPRGRAARAAGPRLLHLPALPHAGRHRLSGARHEEGADLRRATPVTTRCRSRSRGFRSSRCTAGQCSTSSRSRRCAGATSGAGTASGWWCQQRYWHCSPWLPPCPRWRPSRCWPPS